MKRFLLLFGAFMAINGSAYAAITVSATVTGDPIVSPFLNKSSVITITVTLTDDDIATFDADGTGKVVTYVSFATSNNGNPSNGSVGGNRQSNGQAPGIKLEDFDNNHVAEYEIAYGDLLRHGQDLDTEDQKPFDLYIKLSLIHI